ncbi:MAG: LysE family translocator [Campylobacterales bacterium]|nr:LysE family translocator [Campylobacterales bacterium]
MEDFLLLLIVGFVGGITPGPDILLLIRTTIFNCLNDALKILLGVLSGNIILIAIIYFGLSSVSEIKFLTNTIQIVGGTYLLYIAYQIYSHRNDSVELKKEKTTIGFKDGLIINLTNPKAIIYFIVIITPFLNEDFLELKILSLMIGIVTAFSLTIFLANKLKAKLVSPKVIISIDYIAVVVFVFFGVSMFINVFNS